MFDRYCQIISPPLNARIRRSRDILAHACKLSHLILSLLSAPLLMFGSAFADDAPDSIGAQLIGNWSASVVSEEKRFILSDPEMGRCVWIYNRDWDLEITSFDPATHDAKGTISITTHWHASYQPGITNAMKHCFQKTVQSNDDENRSQIDKYYVLLSHEESEPRKFSGLFEQTYCEGDECGDLGFLFFNKFELFASGSISASGSLTSVLHGNSNPIKFEKK